MFKKAILAMLEAVIGGLTNVGGASPDALKFSETGLDLVNKIWDYLMIVGIGMTLIFFLMEMNRKLALEGRDMNIKSMFAPFLKLMISIATLTQGASIISWFLGFNNSLIDSFNGFIGTAAGDATELAANEDLVSTLSFWALLLMGAILLVMAVFNIVLSLVWNYKALTYKLEMMYRVAITPIALADIYSGQNSNAIRWLKGFLALILYGGAFLIITKLGGELVLSEGIDSIAEGDWLGYVGSLASMLVVPFAELGILSTVKQLCKEVVG